MNTHVRSSMYLWSGCNATSCGQDEVWTNTVYDVMRESRECVCGGGEGAGGPDTLENYKS